MANKASNSIPRYLQEISEELKPITQHELLAFDLADKTLRAGSLSALRARNERLGASLRARLEVGVAVQPGKLSLKVCDDGWEIIEGKVKP